MLVPTWAGDSTCSVATLPTRPSAAGRDRLDVHEPQAERRRRDQQRRRDRRFDSAGMSDEAPAQARANGSGIVDGDRDVVGRRARPACIRDQIEQRRAASEPGARRSAAARVGGNPRRHRRDGPDHPFEARVDVRLDAAKRPPRPPAPNRQNSTAPPAMPASAVRTIPPASSRRQLRGGRGSRWMALVNQNTAKVN